MDQLWQQLWNAGIPLGLLAVGIVVLWTTWRSDIAIATKQRDDFIAALADLKAQIATNARETGALTKSLSEFFLKHFP